jgi:hypothetical protein
MAWRSNILQKSFVRDCSSLLKNDLRFTRRWQSLQLAVACCAFCSLIMCYQKCLNFALLKVLPSGRGGCCQLFVAEASSWCCMGVCVDAVSYLFVVVESIRLVTEVASLASLMWSSLVQMVSLQWLEPSVSVFSLWRTQVVVVRCVLSNATFSMLSDVI